MTRFLLKGLTFLFLFSILLKPPEQAFALETEKLGIQPQKVNPGSIYYPLKRAWEKFRGLLVFSSAEKLEYYESLLDKRLSELDYVTEKQLLGEVEQASNRFSFYAGVLVEEWERGPREESSKQKFLEKFERYSEFIDILNDRFPANSAYWLLLRQNKDTLNILTDRLKQ